MFGRGIYLTRVSSKADIYAWNSQGHSDLHVLLICLAFTGRVEMVCEADYDKVTPSAGFDSAEAATLANKGAVAYHESIVYREEVVLPVGLIVYTRQEEPS